MNLFRGDLWCWIVEIQKIKKKLSKEIQKHMIEVLVDFYMSFSKKIFKIGREFTIWIEYIWIVFKVGKLEKIKLKNRNKLNNDLKEGICTFNQNLYFIV